MIAAAVLLHLARNGDVSIAALGIVLMLAFLIMLFLILSAIVALAQMRS